MSDIMEEIFKAIKALLSGTVTLNGVGVPYYVTTFERGQNGIYISNYTEADNSFKQQFGSNVSVTITCFSDNGTVDEVNTIAKQIQNIMYPEKNQNISIGDNWKVTIQNQPSKILLPEEKMAEITYDFLIDVKY